MTFDIPYEPPQPMFADTLLAFQAFNRPSVSVRVSADPLGPVNKVVTLMAGGRRIKSVLYPVNAGTRVEVGSDSRPTISGYSDQWAPLWRYPGGDFWYVDIDGRRVIEVPDHEMRPKSPPPPPIPWHRHAYRALRQALAEQLCADADAIANRLGYHRGCAECGWDE